MSTASVLGRYRDELVEAGFTREEALDLVGHAAPMGMTDLDTISTAKPRNIGPDPLRIVVLAGSREEAERWKNDQFIRNRIDSPDRFILAAGDSTALLGLSGPLAVVALPGFYRLPADERAALEDAFHRANAKV
ncbi:hypothetical protein Q8791_23585 [Nocardiopsis sp. CT-R113]|uniref:Uncharacterized protein n=1 Tax=Nocardiopsis codii TaxID=3065942 RepID=A0ABU7KD95_9ACTN|nr:hypothetical protein [Nocardiopsis sp. CT-R113]MEE2040204.1 hypothetical protein [Nocardiopsis sp. CT-R113]